MRCATNHGREVPNAPETAPITLDSFVVQSEADRFWVSTRMAQHVEVCLDQRRARRWVTFVDLAGSRVRIKAETIRAVVPSTAAQRASDRTLWRRVEAERKEEGEWDD